MLCNCRACAPRCYEVVKHYLQGHVTLEHPLKQQVTDVVVSLHTIHYERETF